ncbi:hypothetical protein [Bradyrhizobium sp. 156]|nr:hypothetical protein [Bradyrhizobium sp. 156]
MTNKKKVQQQVAVQQERKEAERRKALELGLEQWNRKGRHEGR